MRRRAFLHAAAIAALSAPIESASALGRTPYGGKIAFSVPWSLGSLDPHDLYAGYDVRRVKTLNDIVALIAGS